MSVPAPVHASAVPVALPVLPSAPVAAPVAGPAPAPAPVVIYVAAPHFAKLKRSTHKAVAKGGVLGRKGKVTIETRCGKVVDSKPNKKLRKALRKGKVSQTTVDAAIAAAVSTPHNHGHHHKHKHHGHKHKHCHKH
ncbi:MAG TPA: hypothetical protein VN457_05405 [Chlamydiales bacterium]|nr:hypothetical protein [Chlamydiales bacterium]